MHACCLWAVQGCELGAVCRGRAMPGHVKIYVDDRSLEVQGLIARLRAGRALSPALAL